MEALEASVQGNVAILAVLDKSGNVKVRVPSTRSVRGALSDSNVGK
jgi:hypothetical protein